MRPDSSAVELPPCPACGNEDIPPPLVYEASVFSDGETTGLSRCPRCLVYFTRPRLVRHNVRTREATYEEIVRKYGPEARSGFHKNGNYRYYLDLAERDLEARGASRPYRLLDIGSHCGFFLRFAKERGWEVRGVEPAPAQLRFAREVNGIDTIEEGLFGARTHEGESFDLVTMFDVLEHIAEPIELLGLVRSRLRPRGIVIAKVPHIRFYVAFRPLVLALSRVGILPKYPTYTDEPPPEARSSSVPPLFDLFEHVVHYDEAAVAAIFPRAGFASTRVVPAPPTNPRGDSLNAPRSVTYAAARLMHRLDPRPGVITHGLVILGYA
jgi:2-polyprenyl-3-methyl-5-hydroxy-6-metoxy-1,4-benzoquinol methylase